MRTNGNNCDTCKVKIPKYHPKLFCSLCNLQKHHKCQKLSKKDASHIVSSTSQWICRECIFDILPVGACSRAKHKKSDGASTFKASCYSCGGLSYSPKNVRLCPNPCLCPNPWCDNTCHAKCVNNSLGCNKCCEDLQYQAFKFHVQAYQLFNIDLNQRNSNYYKV